MEPTAAPSKDLIQTLLDVASIFVMPDWKALIAMIPIGLALLFAAWFLVTMRKYATVGPRRRAPARVEPLTPANVHMPGGSSAPILVAFGAGALFLGMVLGGLALWIGVAILVITLLAWFREAMRDYDHIEPTQQLPALIHEGPPPLTPFRLRRSSRKLRIVEPSPRCETAPRGLFGQDSLVQS